MVRRTILLVALLASTSALQATPARVEFCNRYPAECAVNLDEEMKIELDGTLWDLIDHVNRDVNHTIIQLTDMEHWGVPDRWDFAEDGKGDCEDMQLLKRKRLREAGIPQRAMRLAIVRDESGGGHAVLVIRTSNHGDWVLDNRRSAILHPQDTGYAFRTIESAFNSGLDPIVDVATLK
jgi:predicted transglutaminase-like cysteine proteinase